MRCADGGRLRASISAVLHGGAKLPVAPQPVAANEIRGLSGFVILRQIGQSDIVCFYLLLREQYPMDRLRRIYQLHQIIKAHWHPATRSAIQKILEYSRVSVTETKQEMP